MSISKTTAVIRKITAVFLAAILCIFLMPTAEAAGSTLTCSAYNATIDVGKSGALLITATGDRSLTASVSDANILSYKWDTKWSSDTTIKLYITGKKAGTSKVYIKNGKSQTITVNVTVKSNTAPKSYGSTSKLIKSDKYSISVKKGGQSSVKITSSNHSLAYKVGDTSIATATPGKWSGNNIKFTIKGKKAGTTYLTVYRKNDKSVAANIKITVGGQSTSQTSTVSKPSTQQSSQDVPVNSNEMTVYWDPTTNTMYIVTGGTYGGETDTDGNSGNNSSNNTTTAKPETSAGNYAEEMLALVNQARSEHGASALSLDSKLCDAANKRAQEIATKFSHTRPDGRDCFTVLDEYGVSYYGCGENIAMGSSSASSIFNMWMNSSGHRANILNSSFRYIGIGKYGNYWVQLFIM